MTAIIPPGTVAWGLQLPIQAQSTIFVEPWEADAGPDDLVDVAQAADRAGALYVGVCEHVAIPKAFTTLDALSGGRAIVGVGAGHVEPEFDLLGVSFADRGRWVERSLPAIRAALDDEYPTLPEGAWGLDGSAGISPRPAQASVPIWVGGSSPVAVRRAAQFGDGWLPQGVKRGDLPGVVARVRELRARAGRPEQFDVGALVGCYVGTPGWDVGRTYVGEPDQLADDLRPWVEAGASQLQVRFRSRDRAELVDQIERFGAEVAPLLAG